MEEVQLIPLPCRKCYQKHSYRRKASNRYYKLQAKLVQHILHNADQYEGVRDWSIEFNKQIGKSLPADTLMAQASDISTAEALNQYRRGKTSARDPVTRRRKTANNQDGDVTEDEEPKLDRQLVSRSSAKKSKSPTKKEEDSTPSAVELEFARVLLDDGLIGHHKTTDDCRDVLARMDKFCTDNKEKHPRHGETLPGIEFLPMGAWGARKPGTKLIMTQDDQGPARADDSADEESPKQKMELPTR